MNTAFIQQWITYIFDVVDRWFEVIFRFIQIRHLISKSVILNNFNKTKDSCLQTKPFVVGWTLLTQSFSFLNCHEIMLQLICGNRASSHHITDTILADVVSLQFMVAWWLITSKLISMSWSLIGKSLYIIRLFIHRLHDRWLGPKF